MFVCCGKIQSPCLSTTTFISGAAASTFPSIGGPVLLTEPMSKTLFGKFYLLLRAMNIGRNAVVHVVKFHVLPQATPKTLPPSLTTIRPLTTTPMLPPSSISTMSPPTPTSTMSPRTRRRKRRAAKPTEETNPASTPAPPARRKWGNSGGKVQAGAARIRRLSLPTQCS